MDGSVDSVKLISIFAGLDCTLFELASPKGKGAATALLRHLGVGVAGAEEEGSDDRELKLKARCKRFGIS